jgi:hypothetical protein
MSLVRRNNFRVIDDDGNIYLYDASLSESLSSNESRKLVIGDTSGNLNRIYYSSNFASSDGNNMIYYASPGITGAQSYSWTFGPVIEADAAIAFVESDNNRITCYFDVNSGHIQNSGNVHSVGSHVADGYYISDNTRGRFQLTEAKSTSDYTSSSTVSTGGAYIQFPTATEATNVGFDAREYRDRWVRQDSPLLQVGGASPVFNPTISFHRVDKTNNTVVQNCQFEGVSRWWRHKQTGGTGSGTEATSSFARASNFALHTPFSSDIDGTYNYINFEVRCTLHKEDYYQNFGSVSASIYSALISMNVKASLHKYGGTATGNWDPVVAYNYEQRIQGNVVALLPSAVSTYANLENYPLSILVDPNLSTTTYWERNATTHIR